MKQVAFKILGTPIAKERPRSTRSGRFYTPTKTKDYEEKVRWAYKRTYKTLKFEREEKVYAEIDIFFKTPKSLTKKKTLEALEQKIFPRKKDIDNIAKAILDALNKIAYEDDTQVVSLKITKQYATEDYVSVKLEGETKWVE